VAIRSADAQRDATCQPGRAARSFRSLRILHLIPSLGGGGAERQLAYLATATANLGDEVHVGFVRGGPHLEALRSSGARIHMFRARGNYDPRLFFQIVRLLRRVRPSIVQTWLPQMDILGGLAAALCGSPWIISERASALAYPPTLKNRLRVRLAAFASAVVANSLHGESYWKVVGSRKLRRFVVPNGVALAELQAVPCRSGRVAEVPTIVFAGRLTAQKNLPNLLQAMAIHAARSDRVVRAHLYGDGPDRAAVQDAITKLDIAETVSLRGYSENLWAEIANADVFMSLSWFEGHPNTVLEAIALGCPVIISDIPEHRAFLDDSSAWFVDPRDPYEVAHVLERVLSDDVERERRRQCGQEVAARYSVGAAVRAYTEVYATLAGPSAAATKGSR
jgi:glycosyltransferase involved in cell wall biosynthesis